METRTIKGREVKVYNSIDELPYKRFVEFNKFVAIDAGTGSSLEEFDQRMQRVYSKQKLAMKALNDGNVKHAEALLRDSTKEQQNVRQSYQFVIRGVSPKMLSFACLVHSINGQPRNDLSAEGLQATVSQLNEEKASVLFDWYNRLKKKIHQEVSRAEGDKINTHEAAFYKLLKEQIRAVAESILEDTDTDSDILYCTI